MAEIPRSPSQRSVHWANQLELKRQSEGSMDLKRALFDRFFDPAALLLFGPSSPPSSKAEGQRPPAASTSKRTPSRRKDRRSPSPQHVPPHPSSTTAATLQAVSASRMCGTVHQQPVPKAWKQELKALRQASVAWNDAQARHQCGRGLLIQVAGLLVVPDLQIEACGFLADMGQRWPPALAGSAKAVAEHLPLPLARPAARGEGLRLVAALVACGESGRDAFTGSTQLMRAAMEPLHQALAVLQPPKEPARAGQAVGAVGAVGQGPDPSAHVPWPQERWGGQKEEVWGPGMSLGYGSLAEQAPARSPQAERQKASASAGPVSAQARERDAVASPGAPLGDRGAAVLSKQQAASQGLGQGLGVGLGIGQGQGREQGWGQAQGWGQGLTPSPSMTPFEYELMLAHAAGAARVLLKLLPWRASAIAVVHDTALAVDPVCRLFKCLARKHLATAAAEDAAVAAVAAVAEAEVEEAAGGEVWGVVEEVVVKSKAELREERRRRLAKRKRARQRAAVLKLLMGCMQRLAALQAPCQRMVVNEVKNGWSKGHAVLPLLIQLLSCGHTENEQRPRAAADGAQAAPASGADAAGMLGAVHARVAARALGCLGAIGDCADSEMRNALRDALGDDESGAVDSLLAVLRADPPRLKAASSAALLLWVLASGNSYKCFDLATKQKALTPVSDLLVTVLTRCKGGSFEVKLPEPPPPPEEAQQLTLGDATGGDGGSIASLTRQGSEARGLSGAGSNHEGSQPPGAAPEEAPPAPPPPPPEPEPLPQMPEDSFVLSTDSDDVPPPTAQPEPGAAEAGADPQGTQGEDAEGVGETATVGEGQGPGEGKGEGQEPSGAATPRRQGSGEQAEEGALGDVGSPLLGGPAWGGSRSGGHSAHGSTAGDETSAAGRAGSAGRQGEGSAAAAGEEEAEEQGEEPEKEAEEEEEEEEEDEGERLRPGRTSWRYEKSEVQQLLCNLLALASSLLSLLGAACDKRGDVAAAVIKAAPGVAASAAFCARAGADSEAAGSGWGVEVRERGLAVLANLCLHEDTAVLAAHCGAAPVLAAEVIDAAFESLPRPQPAPPLSGRPATQGAARSGRAAAAAKAAEAAKAAAQQQKRIHARMALAAPASLITQAAALLANYVRTAPSVRSADSAARDALTFDVGDPWWAPVGEGDGGGVDVGGGASEGGEGSAAGADSQVGMGDLGALPKGWAIEPESLVEKVCRVVPGACGSAATLATDPRPRPSAGLPAPGANPLARSEAPIISQMVATSTPGQLLLVQALASAVACLAKQAPRGSRKPGAHAASVAVGQAALVFADHVPLLCWCPKGADAPRPEAAAAGQACLTACWVLLACGYVHPDLEGLLDRLLLALAPLVRQGCGKKGPPDPWPALLLLAELCRSVTAARRVLTHTPTAEALVAVQMRHGADSGLLSELLTKLQRADRYHVLVKLKLPPLEPVVKIAPAGTGYEGASARRTFGSLPDGARVMTLADLDPTLAAMMAASEADSKAKGDGKGPGKAGAGGGVGTGAGGGTEAVGEARAEEVAVAGETEVAAEGSAAKGLEVGSVEQEGVAGGSQVLRAGGEVGAEGLGEGEEASVDGAEGRLGQQAGMEKGAGGEGGVSSLTIAAEVHEPAAVAVGNLSGGESQGRVGEGKVEAQVPRVEEHKAEAEASRVGTETSTANASALPGGSSFRAERSWSEAPSQAASAATLVPPAADSSAVGGAGVDDGGEEEVYSEDGEGQEEAEGVSVSGGGVEDSVDELDVIGLQATVDHDNGEPGADARAPEAQAPEDGDYEIEDLEEYVLEEELVEEEEEEEEAPLPVPLPVVAPKPPKAALPRHYYG